MSSAAPSLQGSQNNMGTREAFIIGAALIAMLVFLAALRFCCNSFIDIVILDNAEVFCRPFAESFRWAFPRWHVRTQPATANTTTTSVEIPNGNQTTSFPIALTSKILTKADLQEHRATNHKRPNHHHHHADDVESVSSHTLMCSICLRELHEGDCAYIGPCDHIFHKECMFQWVESSGRDCPNCRSEIIPSPIEVNTGDALPPGN
uniref:RING-type domain-containing protein n=1 Tax=Amphora coffeiformis TaxID=265554 RepID=A0A7S3L2S4_9STRA|mmetsp:Transcript_3969/g.7917  ORF Transcript_3969/g.7917 Transcript_3969/m.7917 type:complete len:206 (+) Transcript_3969:142-759(+)